MGRRYPERIWPSRQIEIKLTGSQGSQKLEATRENRSGQAGTENHGWRVLAPRCVLRSASFDQPVFSMIVSELKLAVATLFPVPATGG
jgi:hypothetical protein